MEDLPQESPNMSPPATEKTVGKKRKLSASSLDDEDQPAAKYLELADIFTLDRFSDEILFEIFKNVDTIGLLALEKTCSRFCCLVQDHRLWTGVNLLSIPKSVEDLTITLNRTTNRTKTIKINGLLGDVNRDKRKDQRVCLLNCLVPKCENLLDLELQNVFVDFLKIQIKDFPKNLKRLVFRDVSVRWPDNSPTVFQKMDRHLIWLEELRVESCTWFHPYDIMLFSKCPSLKTLSMRGCQNLSDFVPYGSMASRFGFKTLEHLDVRDTPITDSDLQCFNAILTLKELLLQCPNYLRIKSGGEKNYVPPGTFMYTFTPASCVRILSPIPYYRESGSSAPHSSSAGPQSTSQSSSQSDGSESDSADSNATNAKDGAGPSTSQQADGQEPSKSDGQNQTRTVILHGRVCEIQESEFKRIPHPDNPQGQFSSLLRHPHFWDMIDRQTGPDCGPCVATKPQICPISNRGISCFGRPENPIDRNVIWIRIGHRPNNNNFERLSVRHYKRITDDSLRHLVQCSPNLVYLDVTGCGVTKEGLEEFRAGKPTCEVVCKDLIN